MVPNAYMLVRRETFQLVLVVQDTKQICPMDRVNVVRWAGMSRVHAVGCHLSYDREDSEICAPFLSLPPVGTLLELLILGQSHVVNCKCP